LRRTVGFLKKLCKNEDKPTSSRRLPIKSMTADCFCFRMRCYAR
jgi:hypothetical protein